MTIRALHWVFKIPERTKTIHFYKEILGMKVLRHEEFNEGCAAACNGPYDNRWSKTMIGYGPEDSRFVIELTYNYNVHSYERGNEFGGITIKSRDVIARAKALLWPIEEVGKLFKLEAPGGYPFYIIDEPQPKSSDPVQLVTLKSSNLTKTIDYWEGILGATVFDKGHMDAQLGFGKEQVHVKFESSGRVPIERKEAFGRIAFAIPGAKLPALQEDVKDSGHTILTPLVKLDTPGKASVTVVILADPDGHEICFVDEEGFSELSKVDSQANTLLERFISKETKDRPITTSV